MSNSTRWMNMNDSLRTIRNQTPGIGIEVGTRNEDEISEEETDFLFGLLNGNSEILPERLNPETVPLPHSIGKLVNIVEYLSQRNDNVQEQMREEFKNFPENQNDEQDLSEEYLIKKYNDIIGNEPQTRNLVTLPSLDNPFGANYLSIYKKPFFNKNKYKPKINVNTSRHKAKLDVYTGLFGGEAYATVWMYNKFRFTPPTPGLIDARAAYIVNGVALQWDWGAWGKNDADVELYMRLEQNGSQIGYNSSPAEQKQLFEILTHRAWGYAFTDDPVTIYVGVKLRAYCKGQYQFAYIDYFGDSESNWYIKMPLVMPSLIKLT